METFFEWLRKVERFIGIVFTVVMVLWLIHAVSHPELQTDEEFLRYMRGLIHYIFS